MKRLFITLIVVAGTALVSMVNAAQVQVTANSARVYKNEKRKANDKPIYTAKKGERLTLVVVKGEYVKVKSGSGKVGWVRKNQVKRLTGKSGSGKQTFFMDEAKVLGYLENPQAVYILDMTDPNFKPIRLDRSFRENLAGNIDKETNQRIHDPNLKPEK